jgi:hypothetical protein
VVGLSSGSKTQPRTATPCTGGVPHWKAFGVTNDPYSTPPAIASDGNSLWLGRPTYSISVSVDGNGVAEFDTSCLDFAPK